MSDGKRAGKRSKPRSPQRRDGGSAPQGRGPRGGGNNRSVPARQSRFDNNEFVFQLRYDRNRGNYVGTVAEISDLSVEGRDPEEVYTMLEDAVEDYIVDTRSRGGSVPEPLYTKDYPEKLSLPVSQGLYRRLDLLSRRERVDLEKLAVELLTSAIDKRGERQQRGGGQAAQNQPRDNGNSGSKRNRSQGGKSRNYQNYHQTMDNRENFLDYVRRLEKGRK
ncbi:MAG: hypothetical protein H6617_06655 [Bdellovibrionaceae bacterium]|nr:hypothetical protein [Bdellovibrionales bacterium]MCB9254345.1 hypothetical protein [Pseudobdellovibrionaceae bacterium]